MGTLSTACWRALLPCLWVAGLTTPVASGRLAQPDDTALYACAEGTDARAALVGARLCDAEPTAALTSRAGEDNLQVREGALVTTLDMPGISQTAGLAQDDVIYRVGGVDVDTAEAAAERLALVKTTQDTVVNFLRRGRPYRVTLRQ